MQNRFRFSYKYHVFDWGDDKGAPKSIRGKKKRPCVVVLLRGPNGVEIVEHLLLDSGADYPIIKYDYSQLLGLELGEKKITIKTAGKDAEVYSSTINVGLVQSGGYFNIGEKVFCFVFSEDKTNVPNIMGRVPLFNQFRIIFEEYKESVSLNYISKTYSRLKRRPKG